MTTETRAGLPIFTFADAAAFDDWLAAAPRPSAGIWLKLAKKGSSAAGVPKPAAIDTALCRGWIDGQQAPYDDSWWLTRFTPRRRASRWSQINRTRAMALIAEGRMQLAGLAEIAAARVDGRWDAAYAPASTAAPPADLEAALDRSPAAAAAFAALSRNDWYAALYAIGLPRLAATRARKIEALVTSLNGPTPCHRNLRRDKPC